MKRIALAVLRAGATAFAEEAGRQLGEFAVEQLKKRAAKPRRTRKETHHE